MENNTNPLKTSSGNEDMPRERLLRLGATALADHELLALLLRTGGGGRSVLDFAQYVLRQRGGLVGLLQSEKTQLLPIKGLGKAKIAEIMAVSEMAKRFIAADIKNETWQFRSPKDVRDFLLIHYKGLGLEEMGIILLDNQNRFIGFEYLTGYRKPNEFSIPMRELLSVVLHSHAAAIMLVHNHPSGSTEVSLADKVVTRKIEGLLESIDVRLLDHFIVCGNEVVSMREQNAW